MLTNIWKYDEEPEGISLLSFFFLLISFKKQTKLFEKKQLKMCSISCYFYIYLCILSKYLYRILYGVIYYVLIPIDVNSLLLQLHSMFIYDYSGQTCH